MLNLAFIWHMHQPYYKDLLTEEFQLPWVRLHGIKDYLDMVTILKDFPKIKQTFNIVPSLIEQINDYCQNGKTDNFLALSYKPAAYLTEAEKKFLLDNFFSADVERIISIHPRYYELYLKKISGSGFNNQELLDLQVWFNLAWFDPSLRSSIPQLNKLDIKGRFYTEEEKKAILDKQIEILKQITPAYKQFYESGQIDISITPYYHPILPLLFDTNSAKEAKPKTILPKESFMYPSDLNWHIEEAVKFYKNIFGRYPSGMWPSEEAVSEKILPYIIKAGIKWIIADQAVLFKSLKKYKGTKSPYRPYTLNRKEGNLDIIFRDSELSNLISFEYHHWPTKDAVNDFIKRLEVIGSKENGDEILVVVAMDGENAWEHYPNDGIDFLTLLYQAISKHALIKTTTVSEFLRNYNEKQNISHLASGSWIEGNFDKWIGSREKNLAWEFLSKARRLLEDKKDLDPQTLKKAWLQIYIAEGSDWFWWYGSNHGVFDELYRRHLANFYKIIKEPIPEYLLSAISIDT
jgi:alpha-amylase/alpha-mannosidase (GH57 family)